MRALTVFPRSVRIALTSLFAALAVCGPALAGKTGDENTVAPPKPDWESGHCPMPAWPPMARSAQQEGNTAVNFVVGSDGKILETKLARSSGFPLLDAASMRAISVCVLKPGKASGKAPGARLGIEYRWSFKDDAPPALRETLRAAQFNAARAATLLGSAQTHYRLGKIYIDGELVARNVPEGLRWLRKAAEQDDAEAQYALAKALSESPQGSADLDEVAKLYHKAASQGMAAAQTELGMILNDGHGMARSQSTATAWFRKAAKNGSVEGQNQLALQLLAPQASAAQVQEGIALLRKSVAVNDATAQALLGKCHAVGKGVPQDYVKAASYYEMAALAGNWPAQLALARLYEQGQGVAVDKVKARQLKLAVLAQREKPHPAPSWIDRIL